LYGKVRITSEPYSNSLIVTSNSKENLEVVENVLNQLDQPSEAGESTLHVNLRFAKASTVANNINILFAKNGSPQVRPVAQANQQNQGSQLQPQQQTTYSQSSFELGQETKEDSYYPWLGGTGDNARGTDARNTTRPVSDLVGRVRAVPDLRGNAVLVSANMHFFPQILKLIEDLDAPTDQVLIDARLVEVTTDLMDRLGVRWSPSGQTFTADDMNNSFLISSSAAYTKGFGGTEHNVPFTTANGGSGGTIQEIATSLRSGVISSTINMDFLIQFLHQTTHATVLAEPQLNIRDNETGRLFVGQQVPIPDNTQVSQLGGQNTAFKYKDVGVVLEVTPHINTSGDVELKIHAEASTVVPGQTVLGGAVFDSRAFKTDLTAKNGQTLVLGGIIQKQESETLRKTPILGDIPVVGWLFKKKDKSNQDVELMVFLRPKVVRTPEDAQSLLRETEETAPLVKQLEMDKRPKVSPGQGAHGEVPVEGKPVKPLE
jgi:general secretion pathway protein D